MGNVLTGTQSPSTPYQAGAERLTVPLIWTYSVPRIATSAMGLLFGAYLMKFSTDVLLIAPAAMGSLIAASRLWDAVSDPLAGYLSDRTSARRGRRRSWMYFSALPMGLGFVMMWSPPGSLDGMSMVLWMAAALLVFETASTAFYVPHGALGVELTPNYHERTRLYGYVHMIAAIGTIIGLVALQFLTMVEDKRSFAIVLSLAAGLFTTSTVLWAANRLPERHDYQGRGAASITKSLFDVVRNRHARLLLIVFGIETFGAASVGLLVPYIVEYVLPMQTALVAILITYTIPQFVFTPMWMRLSRRFGKKKLWSFAMWLNATAFIGSFVIVTPGASPVWVWLGAFTLGFASGCGAVVAPAIKADIIDYDEYLTGERKEGSYLAVWNLVRKSAASVTALVTGLVLQLSGFEPNVEQSEQTQLAMRALFALLPGICYVVGALLFLRFDFNEREHDEVRQVLAHRAQERMAQA